MSKCFECGMNLYEIIEKAKKITGINIMDKFTLNNPEKLEKLLNEEKLDICCRIKVITFIPNKYYHYI